MKALMQSAKPEVPTNFFDLESYNYELPADRIAQYPLKKRDTSRLLKLDRSTGNISDKHFSDLDQLLQKGDLVVLNNTRVIPSRLQSDRGEVLLIHETEKNCWDALVYPGKKFRPGDQVQFENGMKAEVLSLSTVGRILRFQNDVDQLLNTHGSLPLPPYITRAADSSDQKRYQTIYAKIRGSIAAPTAGLHFTRKIMNDLRERGIQTARITLHVGPGTFRPVKSDDIRKHSLYPETYFCSKAVWKKIQNAPRVIAVGTTTTRAIESIAATNELQGSTGLFIYPGYKFLITSGLITNFHLPKSSLLMLVSAFGGYKNIRKAYQHAINLGYRFYSYGDAMLIV
ncbi:MAG TPA: tRNA preQ1(34) S-adenosylmethionine ribosyltransferase-isomerase QueA [Acidobacteriota bacterium]